MSLEQIKIVVENFVSDTHNELLVIKGKWGVGKTFFWQKLIEDSNKKKLIGREYYSYVSLFGVNSLEELNNAILVSTVVSNATKPKQKLSALSANLRKLTTSLEKVPALREYTGGLVSSFLHFLLDNTLICFDDIERRGEGLTIKDIFGLASVFKEQRNCKVLLIMNDGSLEKPAREQFKLHGEKIIDREILFSITSEEAFGYVFQPSFHQHDFIKNCCLILHIKNIRILQRIKRFIEDIAPHFKGSEEKVAEDILRSLILYVWSYYDKVNDAPSLEYILDYSIVNTYIRTEYKKEEETPQLKKWDEILSSYNYGRTDDVDKCLAEFVETGYINKPKLADALDKKNEQARAQKGDAAYSKVWGIYRNSFDDNEEEFVDKLVNSFRSNIQFLSFNDLQSVVTALREFERDTLANTLIDEYFSQRNTRKDVEAIKALERTLFVDDLRDEYLLGRLRDIWASEEADRRSLADVLKAITFKEGWSFEDVRHMNSFSMDDYYDFFKGEKSNELYSYVRKCLSFGELNDENGIHKSIGEKAKEALRKIASECRINRMRVSTLYQIDLS